MVISLINSKQLKVGWGQPNDEKAMERRPRRPYNAAETDQRVGGISLYFGMPGGHRRGGGVSHGVEKEVLQKILPLD